MKCQRRTDTSMGCPAMHKWELKEAHKSQRERLSRVKSSIDTRAPAAQPHLTLYGRDYVAKKKATTEAAFSDLKMIQSIARTMTRKQKIDERKGPVSLNADARKADIYRIMEENHRLLEHIDGVEPFTDARSLVDEHKFKRRYVINASHSMRLSGEYDDDISRIRREDRVRKEAQMRSLQLRKEAGERMAKSSGTVSLPALTAVSSVEPSVAPNAKQGAHRRAAPAKGWSGPPGESNAFDLRRGTARQQAKVPKPREAGAATLAKATEPGAARSLPKAAVRFAGGASSSSSSRGSPMSGRPTPTALGRDIEVDEERAPRRVCRSGTPHPSKLVDTPWDVESSDSEAGDGAIEGAATLEEAALAGHDEEDAIVVEDDCVPEPPVPGAMALAPGVGDEPPEAAEPSAKAAPEEYDSDFDDAPDEEAPAKAAPKGADEPPEDSYEEAATPAAEASTDEAGGAPVEDAPAGDTAAKAEVDAPEATEPEAQEPFMVPGAPPQPAVQDEEDDYDDEDFSQGEDEEEEKEAETYGDASQDEFENSKNTAEESASREAEEFASYETPKEEASGETDDASSTGPVVDPEPPEEEPTVEPAAEEVGVSIPEPGLETVSIAQPPAQGAVAEDQGQDEYEDEFEDDFVNENEALEREAQRRDELASFEEHSSSFEETNETSGGA